MFNLTGVGCPRSAKVDAEPKVREIKVASAIERGKAERWSPRSIPLRAKNGAARSGAAPKSCLKDGATVALAPQAGERRLSAPTPAV